MNRNSSRVSDRVTDDDLSQCDSTRGGIELFDKFMEASEDHTASETMEAWELFGISFAGKCYGAENIEKVKTFVGLSADLMKLCSKMLHGEDSRHIICAAALLGRAAWINIETILEEEKRSR